MEKTADTNLLEKNHQEKFQVEGEKHKRLPNHHVLEVLVFNQQEGNAQMSHKKLCSLFFYPLI